MYVNFHCMNPQCSCLINKEIRQDRIAFMGMGNEGTFSMLSPCPRCGYPNTLTIGSGSQVMGIGNQQIGAGDQLIGLENRLMKLRHQFIKANNQLISIS